MSTWPCDKLCLIFKGKERDCGRETRKWETGERRKSETREERKRKRE